MALLRFLNYIFFSPLGQIEKEQGGQNKKAPQRGNYLAEK